MSASASLWPWGTNWLRVRPSSNTVPAGRPRAFPTPAPLARRAIRVRRGGWSGAGFWMFIWAVPRRCYSMAVRTAQERRLAIDTLQHVNIRCIDAAASRDFYVQVIGLKEGYRPPFNFPGHWLYLGEVAVIHLVQKP